MMRGGEKNGACRRLEHAKAGPFDLGNAGAYRRWRAWKLACRPTGAADLTVGITSLETVSEQERDAILELCRRTNMAVYSCRQGSVTDPSAVSAFAAGFGLRSFDRHLCADETGVTALAVAADGPRRTYIPYSDRELSWHTDGYYNEGSKPIRAVLLHCAGDAAEGGENALLDHEIAYIRLRDEDPGYIEALMHPEAMTIPANREGGAEIRPARSGPVFSVDPATGALHMRFSARKRNIVWRDDPATRVAVAFLNDLLADPNGPAVRCRLSPGQGIIANNVLHNRTAFQNDATRQRLLYRIRFFDRIAGEEGDRATQR
jgi:alpha-ketoglutarate-dependent taurine dioxygenase